MREKGAWSEATYRSTAKAVVEKGGSATFLGEERVRQGKGLDPLVDPKGLPKYGPVRDTKNLLVPKDDLFVLEYGVAMPVQTDCDLTGSMGNNVNIFFDVQPKVQNLLIQGKNAVLKRYQAQMSTGAVQDVDDQFPYQRSQFEPDNEVERQMGLLYPEKSGGDSTEDYQVGLFAAAYLTRASITEYGLRGYYFAVGDEVGRDTLDPRGRLLDSVFGPRMADVEKAAGLKNLGELSTLDIGKALLKKWHGFFLQVGRIQYTTEWWREVLGSDRVIILPQTKDLAEVQAVVIGLTEGVLDLQSAKEFLKDGKVGNAERIVEACSGIPIGLQKESPNFEKIPLAGAKFASRDDIWPKGSAKAKASGKKTAPKKSKDKNKEDWKV